MFICVITYVHTADTKEQLDEEYVIKPELLIEEEYSKSELMKIEFEMFGFYLQNHPVTKFRREGACRLNNVYQYFDNYVMVIGLVENLKEISTKNKELMAFLTISDEYGKLSVVLFPNVYKEFSNLNIGNICKIFGKIEKRMNNYQMIVKSLEILFY